MTTLLIVHSITRWLVALTAAALIIRLAVGMVKKLPFDKSARALNAVFSGLMDTQALFGVLLFVLGGFSGIGFPTYRWEHAIIMLIAVAAAHTSVMWKKSDDQIRTRNTLAAVLASLLLVVLGVGPLGWTRWLHITGLF